MLLIKLFGTKIKNILFAFMLCAALLSSIMSNVATTAVLISVVLNFLNVYQDETKRRSSGEAFMIGLPIASMIGGMMTPAGSPLNILGIDFLIVAMISALVFLLLIPIPIGPALITMLGGPFITLAKVWGISATVLIVPLVICASCCFLLSLDTVPLLTYATGYYKMTDMPKVSVAIQLVILVCVSIWAPIALGFCGFL